MKMFWERTLDYIDYDFNSPDDTRIFVPFGELIAQGTWTGVFSLSTFIQNEYNLTENMVLVISFDSLKKEILKSVIPDLKIKSVDLSVQNSLSVILEELQNVFGVSFFFCERLDKLKGISTNHHFKAEAIAGKFISNSEMFHSSKNDFSLKKELLKKCAHEEYNVKALAFVYLRDSFAISRSIGGTDLDFHQNQLVLRNGKIYCIDPFLRY